MDPEQRDQTKRLRHVDIHKLCNNQWRGRILSQLAAGYLLIALASSATSYTTPAAACRQQLDSLQQIRNDRAKTVMDTLSFSAPTCDEQLWHDEHPGMQRLRSSSLLWKLPTPKIDLWAHSLLASCDLLRHTRAGWAPEMVIVHFSKPSKTLTE